MRNMTYKNIQWMLKKFPMNQKFDLRKCMKFLLFILRKLLQNYFIFPFIEPHRNRLKGILKIPFQNLKNVFVMKTMPKARCILKDKIIRNWISMLKGSVYVKAFFLYLWMIAEKFKNLFESHSIWMKNWDSFIAITQTFLQFYDTKLMFCQSGNLSSYYLTTLCKLIEDLRSIFSIYRFRKRQKQKRTF